MTNLVTRSESRARRVELAQGPLHVREFGREDAPPIVFIHGVLANGRLWEGVAGRLADRYRCIVPHWPLGAHAEPMRPDADLSPAGVVALIVSLLGALGIQRAHFVGNDSGGALCQMLVAEHPDRIESVTLTSSDAYDVWLPLVFKPFELSAFVPGALFLVAQMLRVRLLRALPFALGWLCRRMPEDVSDDFVLPLARSRGLRRDVAKFLRGISPRLTMRASAAFSRFDRPVLVAWSKDDRLFSRRLADRLVKDFPKAKLELIDDAYTFSPLDQPKALAERIGTFLESAG
jgi:pimeloyl-ACP methyl ester carboxylesterase